MAVEFTLGRGPRASLEQAMGGLLADYNGTIKT